MNAMHFAPGARYMLAATALFALMNVGVKCLPRIPAHEIVLFRAGVTLVAGYLLLRRAGLHPWGNHKPLLLLRGLAGTVALMMYFYTVQRMPLASAVTIQYLSPVFTVIIAGFFLKEPPRTTQWLFFLISLSGVLLIKGFDARVAPADLAIGVGSAIFSGFAYNFIRKLKDHDHPLVVVFYFPLVTVPVVGAYSLFHWVPPQGWEWAILIGVGLATTGAQIYMTRAFQMERAADVSNFNYLGVVYALAIGYVFFDETMTLLALIGMGIIVGGVVLGARYGRTAG